MYRLLAFDYDGTAAVDGGLPAPRVRETIARARAAGVHLVLATGRLFPSASRYAAALDLTGPVICAQGAVVKDLDSRRTLLTEAMPEAPLAELLALADARHLDLTLYAEEEVFLVGFKRTPEFFQRWFGLPARQVASLVAAPRVMAAEGKLPLKALLIGEPDECDAALAEFTPHFAGQLTVVRSHPMFVEFLNPAASKGHALAFLADRFGVAQAETLAVGDSGNDAPMIQWAGLGVAMGNATPDVKAVANWIAPTVEEDGLAVAIEHFLLRNGDGR